MYVLTDKATGGVYAVTDDEKDEKVVQIFVDKDDALRYYGQLEALDYQRPLQILELEEEHIKANCVNHGYMYCIITPNDLVTPPPDLIL